MEWMPYHDSYAQDHARWNGSSRIRRAGEQEGDTYILIALDSPTATLQVISAVGLATNTTATNIPRSHFWKQGSSSVISIVDPAGNAPFYMIELSSSTETNFNLGIQMIEGGLTSQNYAFSSEISAEGELIIPLEIVVQDGQLGFAEPVITGD